MLLFGHIGITLGVAWVADSVYKERALRKRQRLRTRPCFLKPDFSITDNPDPPEGGGSSPFILDYRLVLLASMLPDIIDKPLGIYILGSVLSNGRIFGHSLLFLLALIIPGIYLYFRKRATWLLVLSFGTGIHVLLDEMWREPATLFWPLLGWFPMSSMDNWILGMIRSLETEPKVYISEIIGALVLAAFFDNLVRWGGVRDFVRRGTTG